MKKNLTTVLLQIFPFSGVLASFYPIHLIFKNLILSLYSVHVFCNAYNLDVNFQRLISLIFSYFLLSLTFCSNFWEDILNLIFWSFYLRLFLLKVLALSLIYTVLFLFHGWKFSFSLKILKLCHCSWYFFSSIFPFSICFEFLFVSIYLFTYLPPLYYFWS